MTRWTTRRPHLVRRRVSWVMLLHWAMATGYPCRPWPYVRARRSAGMDRPMGAHRSVEERRRSS